MPISRRTTTIALTVAGVIVALLAGGAAGWFARGSQIAELEDRIAELERALAEEGEGSSLPNDVETTQTAGDIEEGPADEPPAADTAPPPTTGDTPAASTGQNERQPGIVVEVVPSGGSYVMRIDYVLFLTGGEAADAAAAHGDESPPPNDYYIVNDNPRIREYPIRAGIPVVVVANNDGTFDAAGHVIPLADWVAALSGPQAGAFKSSIYWVTLDNGVITAIEAQYTP